MGCTVWLQVIFKNWDGLRNKTRWHSLRGRRQCRNLSTRHLMSAMRQLNVTGSQLTEMSRALETLYLSTVPQGE